ncbi:MAG: hypothetical protein ISR69_13870 [Gammaproteobacteria bacterium]|nr:hypothetical protein [Gammaproteobacteria bacterium]
MNVFSLAVLSIVMSVFAQFLLKKGMMIGKSNQSFTDIYSLDGFYQIVTNIYIMAGFMLYGLGAVVWLGVLSKWDVSKAYPLVGLGFMLTVIIGFMLGEQVTWIRFMGVVMISVGVWLVAVN